MEKQDDPAAVTASIEDVLECEKRANALVRGFLGLLLRKERSIAAALGYVLALGRDVRANCWELAERAGHNGVECPVFLGQEFAVTSCCYLAI